MGITCFQTGMSFSKKRERHSTSKYQVFYFSWTGLSCSETRHPKSFKKTPTEDSPLMLPDTSITKAMLFSDFRFKNLAKVSSPTVERTSLRKILVASMAMSAAILWRL